MKVLRALIAVTTPEPVRGALVSDLVIDRDDLSDDIRPDLLIPAYLRHFADEHKKILLFGSMGCGKSTELGRLAQTMGDHFLVVGLDTALNEVKRDEITPEELVVLSALAIARAAQTVWGFRLDREIAALQAAITPLVPADATVKLDLAKTLKTLVLFGANLVEPTGTAARAIDLLSKTAEGVEWKQDLRFGGLLRATRETRPGEDILAAANALIQKVTAEGARPPLLILDNLDKIGSAQQAEHLLTHNGLLAGLACSVVLAGPNSLHRTSHLYSLKDHQFQVETLFHVRCWHGEMPAEPDPDGMDKLGQLVDRRIRRALADAGADRSVHDVLSPDARALMLGQSSGVVRDLVHLIEQAARKAIMDGVTRIDVPQVTWAATRLRKKMELALNDGALGILAETALSRGLPDLDRASELLNQNFIVVYSNKHSWFYPHAALWGRLKVV